MAQRRKAPPGGNRYGMHVLALILVLAAVCLAYSNSLSGTWTMDDVVAKGVQEHNISNLFAFRGLTNLTFFLNQSIAPFSPFSFRLFNIFLHFLNAALVYLLVHKTVTLYLKDCCRGVEEEAVEKSAFFAALLSSAVFALHPLNINAVAYIVQRMAALATLFVLLSLLSYIAAAETSKTGKKVLFSAGSGVFLVMGIFSKENAVIAVPLFLLYDYMFLSRFNFRLFRRKILFAVVLGGIVVGFAAYFLKLHSTLGELTQIAMGFDKPIPKKGWTAVDVYWTPLEHILTEFRVVCRYLFLVVLPLPRWLVFDWWNFPLSRGIIDPPATLAAVTVIVSLLGFSLWKIKRLPLVCFGILWYFIAISLESFLSVGADLYFEHRNYLPLAGLILGIGGQIAVTWPNGIRRRVVVVASIILCLTLGSLTFVRNFVWRDPVTFWADAERKHPANLRAVMSLGNAYLRDSDADEALKCYEKVMKLSLSERRANFFNDAAYSLGMIYLNRGDLVKARQLMEKFDRTVESYRTRILTAYYNSLSGRVDEALKEFNEVLPETRGPVDTVMVYTLLGDAYRAKGLWNKALREYRNALSLDPDFSAAYHGMGVSYMAQRNVPLAYEYFSKALALDPHNSLALADMADLMLIRKKPEDALGFAEKSLSTEPFFYQPYLTMANILTVMGQEEEASEFYAKALKHGMPDYMLPFNRARAYYLKGDAEKAGRYVSELRRFNGLPANIRGILR